MNRYTSAEFIQLVHSGKNYFEIVERIINEATHTIHLQTYIFDTDATGSKIMAALERAAQRGVKVCVMADAFGSYPFSKDAEEAMKKAGIQFRLFAPLFSSESIYFGRRLHHKLVVADKIIALTGGINIADKYNVNEEAEPWLDYAVLTRGEVCEYLHLLCEKLYYNHGSGKLRGWEKSLPVVASGAQRLVRFRRNDFIRGWNEIHHSYMQALLTAQRSVTIVASYFLPGAHLRSLLKKATARGVKVKVILAGISDISSVRLAENYLYDFYLRNNIDIYEWNNSVMHGKAMLVDDQWVTIGSYNLNYLSHYISIELNTDIDDADFAGQFGAHLGDVMAHHCNRIGRDVSRGRSAWQRLRIWLAWSFYRMLMNLMLSGGLHSKRKTKR